MTKHVHRIADYEHRRHPVLPRQMFLLRIGRSGLIALGVIGWSLFGGMCGYHYLEDQPWIDAFLNAAMILGGMGPVNPMKTDGGKLFAGSYALYSGLVVIAVAGVLLGPLVHRMLHKFHAESGGKEDK